MNTPANLDQLRAVPSPSDRALSAKAYIAERSAAISEARRIRDQAIAVLIGQGVKDDEIAAACAVSTAHVRLVRRASLIAQ